MRSVLAIITNVYANRFRIPVSCNRLCFMAHVYVSVSDGVGETPRQHRPLFVQSFQRSYILFEEFVVTKRYQHDIFSTISHIEIELS